MAQSLKEYRRKRNFARTAEPAGDDAPTRAEYPRFVIQKHAATRLHYDLRLELDGVFKSWAVTRGPSLDPSEKRLAVEVEDHPLDYGDFEGTIPKGEYGGGTVMLWDRGFWMVDGGRDAAASLRDGELKFVIAGEKLKGSFVLVRIKNDRSGGKRTNWLLIKHRDAWAKPDDGDRILEQAGRSVASGRTMEEIASGTGTRPKPFMAPGAKQIAPDAIWHSKPAAKRRSGRPPLTVSAEDEQPSAPAAAATTNITPSKAGSSRTIVLGVAISKPTKVLWPATGDREAVDKIGYARYLEAVGPWMIEHLRGRPCSLLRAPDGIAGETFFQRHAMAGTSETVARVKVRGDKQPYLQIDTVEGLIGMGQIAALEFHPWNNAPGVPHAPGRLIFDLDPAPDVPFDEVVAAAREVRGRLERVGLEAFCKTTGGKGLHVVTPIGGAERDGLGWPEAKMFAQALSRQMASDSPDRYVTTMSKTRRVGRIFIDYLRNDRTATAVAPLSARARPGAPVSMPVSWPQVRRGLDPQRFTIATVPAMMRTLDLWPGYDEAARPLKEAIQRLVAP